MNFYYINIVKQKEANPTKEKKILTKKKIHKSSSLETHTIK